MKQVFMLEPRLSGNSLPSPCPSLPCCGSRGVHHHALLLTSANSLPLVSFLMQYLTQDPTQQRCCPKPLSTTGS